MHEDKKIENLNNEHIAQLIDIMHCRVSPSSYRNNSKSILS